LTNLKLSEVKLNSISVGNKRPQHIQKSQISSPKQDNKFVNTNAKLNFQISGSRSWFWGSHDWRNMGENERVEGQKSFPTAGGSAQALQMFD